MKNLLFVIGLVSIMGSCSSNTGAETTTSDTTSVAVDSSTMVTVESPIDSTTVDSTLVK